MLKVLISLGGGVPNRSTKVNNETINLLLNICPTFHLYYMVVYYIVSFHIKSGNITSLTVKKKIIIIIPVSLAARCPFQLTAYLMSSFVQAVTTIS